MPVVTIQKVEAVQTKNGKTFYKLTDGNGTESVTWKKALYDIAKSLEGQQAEIETHTEEKNGFTNNYLDAVEPHTPAPASVNGGGTGGNNVPAEVWIEKERREYRGKSIMYAISCYGVEVLGVLSPKAVAEKVLPLAQAFQNEVWRGMDTPAPADPDDGDVPF